MEQAEVPQEKLKRRPPEPLVVMTARLSLEVRGFIVAHRETRPKGIPLERRRWGVYEAPKVLNYYSPLRVITDGARITSRLLSSIVGVSLAHTGLGVADDVLGVMDKGYLLGREIQIYSNPTWPRTKVLSKLRSRGVDLNEPFWQWWPETQRDVMTPQYDPTDDSLVGMEALGGEAQGSSAEEDESWLEERGQVLRSDGGERGSGDEALLSLDELIGRRASP